MKTKVVGLFGALALVVSSAALAQGSGFYGGLGIGKSKAKLNNSDLTLNIAGLEEARDEIDTAYKFFGGYRFGRFVAAELSYTDFGKFSYIYNAVPIDPSLGEARVNYKASSWAVSGVGTVPLGSSGFSALGRLGIAYNTAERSALTGNGFTTNPPIPSATKRRFGLLWGVGGQYDFSPALSVRLEFEDYGKFGEASDSAARFPEQTGRALIHMYALSFIARF